MPQNDFDHIMNHDTCNFEIDYVGSAYKCFRLRIGGVCGFEFCPGKLKIWVEYHDGGLSCWFTLSSLFIIIMILVINNV